MNLRQDVAAPGSPAGAAGPDAGRRVRTRLGGLLLGLLLVVVALGTNALHVRTYTEVGPIDELQHIDYLYRSPAAVAPGDRIGDDAMREQACRGLDYPDFALPTCSPTADYDPDDFQELGYNTASINTPLYYTVTHGLGSALQTVAGAESLVTTGRLVGGLWLAAGLLVAYAAGLRLGARRVPLAAVLVTVACVPAVVYPSSTITPDAATFLAGAAVLWTGLWWEDRPLRRWPALVGVTALVLVLKLTNVAAPLALGVYFVLRLAGRRRAAAPDDVARPAGAVAWWVGGASLAVTAAAVTLTWAAVQAAMTTTDLATIPMNQRFAADALTPGPLVGALGVWLTPLSSPWSVVGDPGATAVLQQVGGVLTASGLVAAALFGRVATRARLLAWATLTVALLGATALVVVTYAMSSVVVPQPARYGYSLVPVTVALTALQLQRRSAVRAVVGVAVASVALSVFRLV